MSIVLDVNHAMVAYYRNDPRRIFHFTKVHALCRLIALSENLEEKTMQILEIAALMHDIGIKISKMKYHSSAGNYQQTEGPPEAMKILDELGVAPDVSERVCYLIGHHHTYKEIDGIDYQILIEADFLVNAYEDEMNHSQITAMRKLFRTQTGLALLEELYSD